MDSVSYPCGIKDACEFERVRAFLLKCRSGEIDPESLGGMQLDLAYRRVLWATDDDPVWETVDPIFPVVVRYTDQPLEDGGHGVRFEHATQWLASAVFFSDFVFRSPLRKSDNKEVCDVLLWCGATVLVVQCKSRSSAGGRTPEDVVRRSCKDLVKGAKQCIGAWKSLSRGDVQDLHNPRRGPVQFAPQAVEVYHGLVLLEHQCEPYDTSASIEGLRQSSIHLHPMLWGDFLFLASFLGTMPDLIGYLNQRAALSDEQLPLLGHERNLLAEWLRNQGQMPITDARPDEHAWEHLEEEEAGGLAYRRWANLWSYMVDDMIDRAHQRDPEQAAATQAEFPGTLTDCYGSFRIVEILSSMPRLHRRMFGQRMIGKRALAG